MEMQSESRMEVMLRYQNNQNQEVASFNGEMKLQNVDLQNQLRAMMAERKNEQGLRDLPFKMVCAYQDHWDEANSVVRYDQITTEFINSNRPNQQPLHHHLHLRCQSCCC